MEDVTVDFRDCMRSFVVYSPHQMLLRWPDHENWDGRSVWQVRGTGEVHTGFWWGSLRERDNFEDRGIDGRIILKWILKK